LTLVSAGRVGRAHGRDGSFYVADARHELSVGTKVTLDDGEHRVERRGGTDSRPLVRLSGIRDVRELQGRLLLVEASLDEGEWLAGDLVGCTVEGLGEVKRVIDAPSCPLLELEDGTLVPFISDAIVAVDVEARRIEADAGWLGQR
jgi:16S rRNA processing protein RimM